jgi:hypothetical protein
MAKGWCNTENYTGLDPHYAYRTSFDWITVRGEVKLWCEDCRYEWEEREDG